MSAVAASISPSSLLAMIGSWLRSEEHPAVPVAKVEVPEEFDGIVALTAPVLGARDRNDLDVLVERAVPEMMTTLQITAEGLDVPGELAELPDPTESNPISRAIGLRFAEQIVQSLRDSQVAGQAIHKLVEELSNPATPLERRKLIMKTFSVTPGDFRDGKVVPGRLRLAVLDQVKGLVTLFATFGAAVQHRKLEHWLAGALAEQTKRGSKEMAWLVASLGRPTGVQLDEEPADMAKLFQDAEAADAELIKMFEQQVRAGNVGVPAED